MGSKKSTQINFQGDGGSYKTAPMRNWPVGKGQVNFEGEGNTLKGGTNRSRGQMNFEGKESIKVKTKESHFGERSGTGCNGGY